MLIRWVGDGPPPGIDTDAGHRGASIERRLAAPDGLNLCDRDDNATCRHNHPLRNATVSSLAAQCVCCTCFEMENAVHATASGSCRGADRRSVPEGEGGASHNRSSGNDPNRSYRLSSGIVEASATVSAARRAARSPALRCRRICRPTAATRGCLSQDSAWQRLGGDDGLTGRPSISEYT